MRSTALYKFVRGSLHLITHGRRSYWAWMAFLLALIAVGAHGYWRQSRVGLIATNMRDQVSWAFYIGNFTFLVGVAAAAVLLVIPAYVYHWKPIKEVAILGELLAVSAIVMCLLFVLVDMGHPERILELVPLLGSLNLPRSILAWDTLVLNGYLIVNLVVITHLLLSAFMRRPYNRSVVIPLVLLSIPLAVSIHTVTAFVYNANAARPFWNASILAPRFIASAFCSGPAILLVLFQVLRRTTRLHISDEAIWKVAELMAYAMFFNLFLVGVELFKEYYSNSAHLIYTQYLYAGIGEHRALVPFAWSALACDVAAFVLFLVPRTRTHWVTLNLGCLLIYAGVYIEKGMGLVIPGLTPDTLGDIYEYRPTGVELQVAAGVFAVGFLVFTLMVKVAVPIITGQFSVDHLEAIERGAEADAAA
jgi:molybdopterin-containing oxidoreductase family membrane subunit